MSGHHSWRKLQSATEAWREARKKSKIALIGDIHAEYGALERIVAQIDPDAAIIQVGDFGYWPYYLEHYMDHMPKRCVLFIDGNHDHVPGCRSCEWPNAVFVPRGTVKEVAGRRVLFLGGATSVDRKRRPHNGGHHAWFDDEVVSEDDVARALANAKDGVDLMVTHTPPDWMIRKNFSPNGLRSFGIDPDTWRDLAAERVEQVWHELGEPPLYCGHMHQSVQDGNCRILDINEVVLI